MCTTGRCRNRFAFTLIELVAVIAILGIVAGFVGGPTLAYVDSMRSRAAASRLAGDIRYMQRTALSAGLRTWVVFDTGANNYRLYVEDQANPGKANRQAAAHPLDQTTDAVQFGAAPFTNVSILSVEVGGSATTELEFDSFGVPYDDSSSALSANAVITLSNGVTITVHPVGGFVERAG